MAERVGELVVALAQNWSSSAMPTLAPSLTARLYTASTPSVYMCNVTGLEAAGAPAGEKSSEIITIESPILSRACTTWPLGVVSFWSTCGPNTFLYQSIALPAPGTERYGVTVRMSLGFALNRRFVSAISASCPAVTANNPGLTPSP